MRIPAGLMILLAALQSLHSEMTTFLNILLLAIGTTATLAAFGGETCAKGPKRLIRRITERGWVSLLCLFLALLIGIAKEIQTTGDARKTRDEHNQELASANGQNRALSEALEATRGELAAVKRVQTDEQTTLGQEKSTLNDVHGTLDATRKYLDEATASTIVTSLANEGVTVKELLVYVSMTKYANHSTEIRRALLPSFENRECRDLTGLSIGVLTDPRSAQTIYYTPGEDKANRHDYFNDQIKKKDEMVDTVADGVQQSLIDANKYQGQLTSNGMRYVAIFHTAGHSISAAQIFSTFSKPNAAMFGIQTSWPTVFRSLDSLSHYADIYPQVLEGAGNIPSLADSNDIAMYSKTVAPYPAKCSAAVQRYFRQAFDTATLLMVLEHRENEMISVTLKAKPPELIDGMWYLPFVASGAPSIQEFGENGLTLNWGEEPNTEQQK
jgi:hypothetical protein